MSVSDGAITFFVQFNVPSSEMATWTPERIHAFMAGIAAVSAARSGNPQPECCCSDRERAAKEADGE